MMEIKEIISLSTHCLHLCNNSNMEEIVFSYMADADAFVTNDVEAWKNKFKENEIECPVKAPNDATSNERIIVDGSSLSEDFEKWEKRWGKQRGAICIYNIDKFDRSKLKYLVDAHDKMLLSVNKIRMYSDKVLENEIDNLNPKVVEDLVKKELRNIVLSMLLSTPMCGTDLVKLLYNKFKVFISPGKLYPTLHELEKAGLLNYEYNLKNKIYSVKEKEQAKLLLKNHVKANSLFSQMLVNE